MCLVEGQTHSSSVLWPVLLASWENIGTSSPALVCLSPGREGRGALVRTCVTDAIPWGESEYLEVACFSFYCILLKNLIPDSFADKLSWLSAEEP